MRGHRVLNPERGAKPAPCRPAHSSPSFGVGTPQRCDCPSQSVRIARGHNQARFVNEQWPEYWARLFQAHGYEVFDIVRPRIWADCAIPTWYRQHILLFVKASRVPSMPGIQGRQSLGPLSLVHPEIYRKVHRKRLGIGKLVIFIRGR